MDSMERTGNSQEKGNFNRFLEWIVLGFGNGNGKVCLEHGILRKKPNKLRVKPAFFPYGNVRVCCYFESQVLSFSASVVGTELSLGNREGADGNRMFVWPTVFVYKK